MVSLRVRPTSVGDGVMLLALLTERAGIVQADVTALDVRGMEPAVAEHALLAAVARMERALEADL